MTMSPQLRALLVDETIRPDLDDAVPLYSEDKCPSFEGKRCNILGHRPSHVCEPAAARLVSIAEHAVAMKDQFEHAVAMKDQSGPASTRRCTRCPAEAEGFFIHPDGHVELVCTDCGTVLEHARRGNKEPS